jgi:SAM-dependent methyltransferase
MAAQLGILLLALLSIGRRVVFAVCVLAVMLSQGGWYSIDLSLGSEKRTRSYFGIYAVSDEADLRYLTHGTTLHGMQSLKPELRLQPTSYYAPRSGVGLVMRAAGTLYGPKASIGVVGLGTGTLACYAVPGQDWRFFEIDPAMVRIARTQFSYLPECAPTAKIVLGDARLSLERQPPAQLDILALDAFSSDAVPTHLLTHEAFAAYAKALQPSGILLVHISNRFVDLEPVVAEAAARGGWDAMFLSYQPTTEEYARHASVSDWIALTRDPRMIDDMLAATQREGFWRDLEPRPGFAGWSDDRASILPILKPLPTDLFDFGD